MNCDLVSLPNISKKITESKRESLIKINTPPVESYASNFAINKIIKFCMNKKNKSKFKMKIKKEFIGFQKSNKYLLKDKYNKLLINSPKNSNKRNSCHSMNIYSFGNNVSNLMNKNNTFYKCDEKKNNNNIYHSNKKLSSYSRSKNIYLDRNLINDNTSSRTQRKYSEKKNEKIKSLSQKKVNNINYCKLFSSFCPFTSLKEKLKDNFNILISNNNREKKIKNTYIEEPKNKFNILQKKILTSTNPSSSIEITDKNENEYNLLKNKIKKNFEFTIRHNFFSTKLNKKRNNNNNIKNEYIEHIKSLSFKIINGQLNSPKKNLNNMNQLKMNNKLYDYNHIKYNNINNNEKNDFERNDLEIFLKLLNTHLKIENIIMKMKNNNTILFLDIENKNKLKTIKDIMELIIKFFSILKLITFDIDFLVEINKNRLVRKTIKILISYYSFLLIILKQSNSQISLNEIENIKIFFQLSKILYNIFEHFIFPDLINNNYNLNFINLFNEIINKNKYIIKNDNNIRDVLPILVKKLDESLNNLKIKIEEKCKDKKYISIIPAFNAVLLLLNNINNKSILMFINITINVILFSILSYNNGNSINIYNNRNKINKSVPYLPPIDDKYKYTLVLDLDETLIHFLYKNKNNNNILKFNMIEQNDIINLGMFLLRPYTKLFFEKLKDFYEIIIFTNGTKEYCDRILDLIDPNIEFIKFRLYRKHSINKYDDIYLKDLSLLGRDLSKIIIIDDSEKNYKLQKDNGLPIKAWKGDINDSTLKDLIPILKKIVENNIEDVRKIIVKIKNILKNENIDNYFVINNIENNDLFVDDL